MTAAAAGQAPGTEPAELTTGYQRTYPGQTDQVRHVRHDVAEHLGDCPAAASTVLIASEIATNSIVHSRSRGGHFTIRIEVHRDCLRIECRDAGGPWRGRRRTDDHDEYSRGLSIVAALTGPGAWGAEVTGDGGRIVWASLTW
jgi:two-component sensor histidine kinase